MSVLDSPSATVTDYYGYARPEVRDLVPAGARQILDIGCGAGALGASLKQRQRCHVTGIEAVPEAATAARAHLDDVRSGDAFEELAALPLEHFDTIILADMLEHVADTDGLLSLARERLAPSGRLVLSIPNVRHWSVLMPLLAGRWDYREAGILDRTHLRFFTRHSMREALEQNGFWIEAMSATLMPLAIPRELFLPLSHAEIDVADLVEDLQRYQYLWVCGKNARVDAAG